MPERRRVRWSQLKVGAVGIVAFCILFVLVFLLTSSKGIFHHYEPLYTYMDDASGVAVNSPVRLNGIIVGYLGGLILTRSKNPKRAVQFDMLVREQYLKDIPVDSVVAITAANLLGEQYLNITKGTSTETVKPGATLPSQQVQDIPELMAQSATVLQTLQTITSRVDTMLAGIEAGKGNIGKLLKDEELYDRLNGIAREGQQLLSDIRNGHGTISKLIYDDALYNEIRAPLRRIDSIMAGLQSGQGTAGKLLKDPALYDEARQSIVQLRTLLADLKAGKGTAGKLLTDEQLYRRIDLLAGKLNTTVDRINSGRGTLGQIVVNPELYDSLNSATREAQQLLRDIRANPKKFLTLRLALF